MKRDFTSKRYALDGTIADKTESEVRNRFDGKASNLAVEEEEEEVEVDWLETGEMETGDELFLLLFSEEVWAIDDGVEREGIIVDDMPYFCEESERWLVDIAVVVDVSMATSASSSWDVVGGEGTNW